MVVYHRPPLQCDYMNSWFGTEKKDMLVELCIRGPLSDLVSVGVSIAGLWPRFNQNEEEIAAYDCGLLSPYVRMYHIVSKDRPAIVHVAHP